MVVLPGPPYSIRSYAVWLTWSAQPNDGAGYHHCAIHCIKGEAEAYDALLPAG